MTTLRETKARHPKATVEQVDSKQLFYSYYPDYTLLISYNYSWVLFWFWLVDYYREA